MNSAVSTAAQALALAVLLAAPAAAQASSPAATGSHTIVRVPITGVQNAYGKPSDLDVVLPVSPGRAWPTVLFVHGWFAEPSYYDGLIENLASRGFAVAVMDQVNRFDTRLEKWVAGGRNAIDAVFAAGNDPSSALFGQLDLRRFAVVGHSYGGSTAISLGDDPRVKTVVSLSPGCAPQERALLLRNAGLALAPVLVIGAEFDPLVPVRRFAYPAFQKLRHPQRLYVEMARAEHNNYTDFSAAFLVARPFRLPQWTLSPGEHRRVSREYTNAWLEHHLGVQPDTRGWTSGAKARADRDAGIVSRPER